jgi:hypothetical protein
MSPSAAPVSNWIRLGASSGLAGVGCYFSAAFLPLPHGIAMLLAFAFGPFLILSFLGMYRFMAQHRNGPLLQAACLFGVIAGVMVTLMLVVQIGNNMVRAESLAAADTEAAEAAARLAWRAVNRVQYLVDVVWDIFICAASMLLGAAMLGHPAFGRVWGGLGMAAGLLLLVLNLQTFPVAPAEAGSVDAGPLVAIWMMAVFIRMLLLQRPA